MLDGERFLPWCPSRAQTAARRNGRTFRSAIPVRMLDALAFGNPSTSCSFLLGAAVRPPLAADLSSAAEDCLFLLRQEIGLTDLKIGHYIWVRRAEARRLHLPCTATSNRV